MVTSDFRPEVEIRQFCSCILKNMHVHQTLQNVWPSPGLVHVNFRGLLPLVEFCQVHISLCIQVLHLLHWQRYCTALEQWASAKLCGVVSSCDRAAIQLDIGWLNCLVDNAVQLINRSFLVAGSCVCNCLPSYLHPYTSKEQFKWLLNTVLFGS